MTSDFERPVVVLGAGPAGAAVALGLRRLGHTVTVVGVPRAFDAIEGVSDRVVAGLHFPVDSIAGKLLGQRLGRYFVSQCIGSKGSQEATFSGEQVPDEAEPSAGVKYGTDPGTSLGADSKTPTKPNAMLAKAWSLAAKEWR